MKYFKTALLATVFALAPMMPVSSQEAASVDKGQAVNEQRQTFSIFMLVKTTNVWLTLSPEERFAFLDREINPILQKYPDVNMQFFDTEGFNSRVTDVVLWKTQDLESYQAVVENLREGNFWGTYFEVIEILPGIENAYASYYEVDPY